MQATWNLLEPSAGPALARGARAGLGVIVKEALANGRLTAARRPLPALERGRAAARARRPTPWPSAAVLAQPWADVVLSGAATRGALASNLAAP